MMAQPPAPRQQTSGAKKQTVNLPTSKRLMLPAPGAPQRTNSLPVAMALSPNGRYVAILNAGYGARESQFRQSIAVLDLETNRLTDFPDARLGFHAEQSYFGGIAFSTDGAHVYASVGSLSDPKGEGPKPEVTREDKKNPAEHGVEKKPNPNTGNGIAVYSFTAGRLAPERFIRIAPQPIPPGKHAPKLLFKRLPPNQTAPFPAGIAVFSSCGIDTCQDLLLVANNLSDNAVLLNLDFTVGADHVSPELLREYGEQFASITLGATDLIPSSYPVNVVIDSGKNRPRPWPTEHRAWISLWNSSTVVEISQDHWKVTRRIQLLDPKSPQEPGSHPTAMLLSPDEKFLYVTLSNSDRAAMIEAASGRILRLLQAQLPNQRYGGAIPVALAQTADGKRLFVACAGLNAIAVFDTTSNSDQPIGFIPTEWYPTALIMRGNDLIVATGKGIGTGANSASVPPEESGRPPLKHPYIASLIHGSVARIRWSEAERELPALTEEVMQANLMRERAQQIAFAGGHNPIRHVLYIIKENRTYDQIFGDIKEGNGDPSLVM